MREHRSITLQVLLRILLLDDLSFQAKQLHMLSHVLEVHGCGCHLLEFHFLIPNTRESFFSVLLLIIFGLNFVNCNVRLRVLLALRSLDYLL